LFLRFLAFAFAPVVYILSCLAFFFSYWFNNVNHPSWAD
jgi:hypothetical protein